MIITKCVHLHALPAINHKFVGAYAFFLGVGGLGRMQILKGPICPLSL